MAQDSEQFDVIIVGAGISGISAAVHLKQACPDKRICILERRENVGGTWDLFRYPGIRSDSDMHTLGFEFKPWTEQESIADGPSIMRYLKETVAEHHLADHIRTGHQVLAADWCSKAGSWSLKVQHKGEEKQLAATFLFMCSGYYSHDEAHDAKIPGADQFAGPVVLPQFWPEDLDYVGKRVIVVGSGATAMTIVPRMAEEGARVTMLQRSPTYVASRPDKDRLANFLRGVLPEKWAYAITRLRNIRLQEQIYRRSRAAPEKVKAFLLGMVKKGLPEGYDVETHFTPKYNPWDQRLCLIPNGDLFKAISSGQAEVVTAAIDQITETGIRLESGETLEADIIILATGLKMVLLADVPFTRDGEAIDFAKTFTYKGMMFSGVPNLVSTFGYINASWTLRADLTANWVCRLLQHMDQLGADTVTAERQEKPEEARPWITDFPAGYMSRAMHLFPRQANGPWRNTQDFALDKKLLKQAPVADEVLVFEHLPDVDRRQSDDQSPPGKAVSAG